MNREEIRSFFEHRKESQLKEITELVDIDSPSFDEAGIRTAIEYVEDIFRPLRSVSGAQKDYFPGFGDHITIRTKGEGNPVLVLGHIDTVHPIGARDRNPTRVEGDRLYGCGTFDMKANIVVVAESLRAIEHFGLSARPVNFLLSCDEEVGSDTGRALVEREASDSEFCLVLEPSMNGKVKTGRKGTGMYTLRTKGIPAHAGLDPEKGVSAILELSKQIPLLHEMNDPGRGITVTVGTIQGGTTSNVVPEHAECSIDTRFESMGEAEEIDSAIRGLKAFDDRVELSLEGDINRPPLERTEAVVNLFNQARTIAADFGFELEETQVGGASDGNFVSALGVPVLDGLGLKGNGAHTLDEFIVIDDLPNRCALLTGLLHAA